MPVSRRTPTSPRIRIVRFTEVCRRLRHHRAPQVGGRLPPSVETLRGELAPALGIGGPGDDTHRVDDLGDGHCPSRDHTPCLLPDAIGPRDDLAALLTQNPTLMFSRVAFSRLTLSGFGPMS